MLEGVAFGLRDGLDLMVAAGMPRPAQIRASGGGTRSPLWRQILADVLEAEIATVNTTEGRRTAPPCWPRSARAGSDGRRRDAAFVRTTRRRTRSGRARTASARPYRELYPALAPMFHRG